MRGYLQPRGKNTWRLRFPRENLPEYSETFKGLKREAEERLSELIAAYGRGELSSSIKFSLAEFYDEWLEKALNGSVAPRTYRDYVELFDRYIREKLGHIKLAKLSALDVQGLYNEMRERGLSSRTIRYTHIVLSKALTQAMKWNYISRNVAKLTDLPKAEKTEMRAMSPKQIQQFLRAAKKDKLYAMWHIAISTGLRPEEYLALRWTDIKNDCLVVQRAVVYNRKGGGYYYAQVKTARGMRTIPLTTTLLRLLELHKQDQLEQRTAAGENWKEEGLIFPSTTGRPYLLSNLTRRHFKPILTEAGLATQFRVYDLRHTHASYLLNSKKMTIKEVSERLGHASTRITQDTYWHTPDDAQKKASDYFEDSILAGDLSPVMPVDIGSRGQKVAERKKNSF